MDPEMDPYQQQRATFLAGLLAVLAGAGILGLLFLICGGLSLEFLAVLIVAGVVGMAHYALWGQTLSREVDEERAAEEEGAEFLEEDAPPRTY